MSKIEQYHLHKLSPQKLQFEIYDLKSYRKKSSNKATQPHSHSYYQIIWFFSSGGKHLVDFKEYKVKENTILFISKGQIHAFDENLEGDGWLIHFNESFFMHTEADIFLKYAIFKTQENPCYAMETDTIAKCNTYIDLIVKELSHRNRFGFENMVRFLLKCFLIDLERVHQNREPEKIISPSSYTLRFYEFKELIERNYEKNLTVGQYAESMFISTKTLSTITKKIGSKSPSEFITERVILQSKRLLKFTGLQISEIAYKLGFEDPSYFIKFFKRHVAISPKKFRSNH
ncbi:AraC family transcriptional regulator [Flagellimonas sp. HMM57]|uniref:AraC family transcriptional regulator n=1 Tax=unclassified Flagellimonas TaxID=2644544 RepID=UPI001F0B0BFD|nr:MULTISPECIES: AraC family transcriptional regulator [unclassified Flagellimonas]UII74841.1 AraC family transcriptional regulator [Flagellimonas sp. HMM57]